MDSLGKIIKLVLMAINCWIWVVAAPFEVCGLSSGHGAHQSLPTQDSEAGW